MAQRCRLWTRFRASHLALAFALVSAAAACERAPSAPPPSAPAPRAAAPAAEPEVVISVMALNDLHGRLGALPAFAGYIEARRRALAGRGDVLVVDAGDLFQGTLASNATEGESVIRAYNRLGLRAAALGNHEFDYGALDGATSGQAASAQGALRTRLEQADFPVLSANLIESATEQLPFWNHLQADTIVTIAGVRVGLVGVLTAETPSIVMPDYFAGLSVSPLVPAVERHARELRMRGADAVLVLAHAGADCKRFDDPNDLSSCDAATAEVFALARALPRGLVDGIIAGHTHAGAAHFVNGTAIVESFSRGKAFSRLDLHVGGAPRRVLGVTIHPPEPLCPDSAELAPCPTHDYEGQRVETSAALAALIDPALEHARAVPGAARPRVRARQLVQRRHA